MEDLCFVCMEPTNETSQCVCRATVHSKCLVKALNSKQTVNCVICKTPIANVHRSRKHVVKCNEFTLVVVILFGCASVLTTISACFVVISVPERSRGKERTIFASLFGVMGTVACAVACVAGRRYGNENHCIVTREEVSLRTTELV